MTWLKEVEQQSGIEPEPAGVTARQPERFLGDRQMGRNQGVALSFWEATCLPVSHQDLFLLKTDPLT